MNFLRRTATALLFGVVVLGVVYLGDLPWLIALLLATAILCVEFYGIARQAGYQPSVIVGTALALALVAQTYVQIDLTWPLLSLALVTTAVWGYLVRAPSQSFLADWACTFAGALYIGGLLLHGILLRNLTDGLTWTLIALLGTWSCDAGAYIIGSRFGRHKFAPRISPNKTWEGAVGSVLCSFAVVMVMAWVLEIPLVYGAGLGVLIPLATISGDLTESMLKRSAGVKDSGTLLPGHGGLLDRLDSLLFVFPTVYYVVAVGAS
jgi:phosphatidate cytidylyltransferase